MKNLTTGIMTLFNATTGGVNNDFYNSIEGKLFKSRVPMGTPLPYAIFTVISDVQDDTFKDTISNVSLEFSLYSASSSSSEIEDMYTYLKALFDDVQFAVTGNTIVTMTREQAGFLSIPSDNDEGTDEIYQYDVDYNCIMQKN